MSIHDFPNKIKGWVRGHRERLVQLAVLVLTASAFSFIGYVLRAETHKEPLVAIACPIGAYMDAKQLSTTTTTQQKQSIDQSPISTVMSPYVASKNGKKYYPAQCAAAKRIKDANKIFFESAASAESAGLTLGSGCSK